MSKDKAAVLTYEQKIKNLRAATTERETNNLATPFDLDDLLEQSRKGPLATFKE